MSTQIEFYNSLHNRTYSSLVSRYDDLTDLMRKIRLEVITGILNGRSQFDIKSFQHSGVQLIDSAIDIGCANGDNLVLMRELGIKNLTGIDIADAMIKEAEERLPEGILLNGDFRNLGTAKKYDLVFAQALVHLFPKRELPEILAKMMQLSKKYVYFSTTMHEVSKEGLEEKAENNFRFRSRYQEHELLSIISKFLSKNPNWTLRYFFLTDPLGKNWINCILDKGICQ